MNIRPYLLCCLLLSGAALLLAGCSGKPEPVITAADGSEMIYIPAGHFSMGGRLEDLQDRPDISGYRNYEAERPVHEVSLDAFYIDRYEITQSQYARFLYAWDADERHAMDHPDQPRDLDHAPRHVGPAREDSDLPAVGLNWFDAYAYCKWAGKRLLTEAEWEYAARGGDGVYRTYPWGNDAPDRDGIWRANYWPQGGRGKDGFKFTAPVGSFPDGISPFGVLDMAGNAEEWVQDWLDFNYYKSPDAGVNPKGPESGAKKVIKGGSQISDRHGIRIATRLYGAPHVKTPNQGIRCARNP